MDLKGVAHTEERIDALRRSGALNPEAVRETIVLPAAAMPRPARLIPGTEGGSPGWIGTHHRNQAERQAAAVNCYTVEGLVIGGIGYAFVQDRLILSPEIMPPYWHATLTDDRQEEPARVVALPLRRIAGRTVAFTGWGTDTYGHLLVEMLPRLLVAREALGGFAGAKLLLPADSPAWFDDILRQALGGTLPAVERYDTLRERVVLEEGVLPGLPLQRDGFHPGLNPLMDRLRDALIGPQAASLAPRVFVSRALFFNPATMRRRCLNELRIAEIAATEYGFAVIAPETLPWATQMRLMAGAEIIAGEFGSALHGAIFARSGTRVAALGIGNLTQSQIADLRGQEIAYLATETPNALGRYAIDEWAFRRFMDAVVR